MNKTVSDTIAAALIKLKVDTVFTLIGTGNFSHIHPLAEGGVTINRARHENGVVSMATAWAQVTGRIGVCSVSKGAGLTHAMSALVEADKSRTPLLVLVGDTPPHAIYSNPGMPQVPMVSGAGLLSDAVYGADSAPDDILRAYMRAQSERRPVLLMISSVVSRLAVPADIELHAEPKAPATPQPSPEAVAQACALIAGAKRPAILAGMGVVIADAGAELAALAEQSDAILATTLRANGLFAGDPFCVGISGGYSTPLAVERLNSADVALVFGASMNDWTTRAGTIFPNARIVQVDTHPRAFGKHHGVDLAILGDVGVVARAMREQLGRDGADKTGYRSAALAADIAASLVLPEGDPARADGKIDPRTLTRMIDDMVPRDRTVVTDGGGFLNYSVKFRPSDARGFVVPLIYMALGTGIPAALGAAQARTDRVTIGAVGDAGALMGLADLETMARLGGPLLMVIYNDAAHGGEVEFYTGKYSRIDLLKFDDFDFAAVARAAGVDAITVRTPADLKPIEEWLRDPKKPLIVDAKVGAIPPSDELFAGDSSWSLKLLHRQGY
jgi:thiamine pyrophosphate-dependent acetolactate synthase large subunit-like protein